MKKIDYADRLKDFRERLLRLPEGALLGDAGTEGTTEAVSNDFMVIVYLPDKMLADEVVDTYIISDTRIDVDLVSNDDIVCEFIDICSKGLNNENDFEIYEPNKGLDDFSFLLNDLDDFDVERLIMLRVLPDDTDGTCSRHIIAVPVQIIIDSLVNGTLSAFVPEFDDSLVDYNSDDLNIAELDPNDESIRIIRTLEPEESIEEYLENSRAWLDQIANSKKDLREAHANIIVTLRDSYLQTFEQIANLLREYYGVVRTRQSIHSMYERAKHKESSLADYDTQRSIIIQRILGLTISKIHDSFPQLTEYGINEIIKKNIREQEELKDALADQIAKKLAAYVADTGEYKACGEYGSDIGIRLKSALEDIKQTLEAPAEDISDTEFKKLVGLAVEKLAKDRITVLASVLYETQTPSLKSAKKFMTEHGVSDKHITAKNLKDLWFN